MAKPSKRARNRHNLSRHIPENVKREVRRRSKYGCVICRELMCEYEHILPTFSDAAVHDPEKICLLCVRHHDEVTLGRLSKSQVEQAYKRVQSCDSVSSPFYQPTFSGGLKLTLGKAKFLHMPEDGSVLEYDGLPILRVNYVADEVFGGSRPSITGMLVDVLGNPLLELEDNQITFICAGLDIATRGQWITVSKSGRRVVMRLAIDPPNGFLIERLVMSVGEIAVDFDGDLGVYAPTSYGLREHWKVPVLVASAARAAISYQSDRAKWHGENIHCGPGGYSIPRTGVTFAAGALAIAASGARVAKMPF